MAATLRQSTPLSTAFANPLVVVVTPTLAGEPVADGVVTYTGPATGASLATTPVTATIATNGEASLSASANAILGSYTVTATANGATSSAAFNLTNAQATPTITWSAPAAITYGTALDASQLTATADVAGSFSYTPTAGTVLNAGNGQVLQAVFTPDDQVTYATVTTTVQLDVAPAPLVVTANNATGVAGEPLPPLGFGVTGLVNGDTQDSAFTTAPTLATTATASSPAGDYLITASGGVAPNYAISYTNGTLTISGSGSPVTTTTVFLPLLGR